MIKLNTLIWIGFIWATAHIVFNYFFYDLGIDLDWLIMWFILNFMVMKTMGLQSKDSGEGK